MEEPRFTPVVSEPIATVRERFNFAEFFARKDRLTLLSVGLALLALVATVMAILYALNLGRRGTLFVVLDEAGNWTPAPGATFGEAGHLHVQQALLATSALFLRSPEDFDQPEIIELMFSRDALNQAIQFKGIEAPEFHERAIHQKPQVSRVTAIETRDDRAQIEVSGELLRHGTQAEVAFTEVIPFTLRLVLRPNPDLLSRQRQPSIVTAFELAYESPRP